MTESLTKRQSPRDLEIRHPPSQLAMTLRKEEVKRNMQLESPRRVQFVSLTGFERMRESTESSSISDGFTQCNSEHTSSSDVVTAGSGGDNHLKRVDGVETTRRPFGRRSLLLGGRMYLLFHIIPVLSASVLFWIELDIPPSQYRNETNVSRRLAARSFQ